MFCYACLLREQMVNFRNDKLVGFLAEDKGNMKGGILSRDVAYPAQ